MTNWFKTTWSTFQQSGVYHTLSCWIGLPKNIRLLRQEKALLDEMQRKNPGQNVYYLPPPRN